MMTLKIISKYKDKQNFDRLTTYIVELPKDPYLSLSLIAYSSLLDYNTAIKRYNLFDPRKTPIRYYGKEPSAPDITYNREFLEISYVNLDGKFEYIIVNQGTVYIVQDGKTVEKFIIEDPNINNKLLEL